MVPLIPASIPEIEALCQQPISAEVVAVAMVATVQLAQNHYLTLPQLQAAILHNDGLLAATDRQWLCDLMTEIWQEMAAHNSPSMAA